MKTTSAITCAALFCAFLSIAAHAGLLQDYRAEADQYYSAQDYKKAFRGYEKLARIGDHYAQDRLAAMYAEGKGKSADLEVAYAWSVLAAEGGDEAFVNRSQEYLAQAGDKKGAEKEAEKLSKKYGRAALEKKAEKRESMKASPGMGGCTSARLGCSKNR